MSTATDAARAMLESMPARSGMTQSQAALELESIRANVFFGAFAKYEQPYVPSWCLIPSRGAQSADPAHSAPGSRTC